MKGSKKFHTDKEFNDVVTPATVGVASTASIQDISLEDLSPYFTQKLVLRKEKSAKSMTNPET